MTSWFSSRTVNPRPFAHRNPIKDWRPDGSNRLDQNVLIPNAIRKMVKLISDLAKTVRVLKKSLGFLAQTPAAGAQSLRSDGRVAGGFASAANTDRKTPGFG
jgi:hypothetical protein